MKKRLSAVLIIILILNLIMPNVLVIAYPDEIDSSIDKESGREILEQMNPDLVNDLLNKGEATQNPASGEAGSNSYQINSTPTQITVDHISGAGLAGVLANVACFFPAAISAVLDIIVNSGNTETEVKEFTIQDTVLGNYGLFDINFFDINENSTSKDTRGEGVDRIATEGVNVNTFMEFLEGSGNVNKIIKVQVATWYGIIRNLAIIISLCVLLYVGIRMAISTLAVDKATYKAKLIDWLTGFALIFIIHYIVLFTMNIANAVMNILPEPEDNMEILILDGEKGEDGIRSKVSKQKGWNLFFTCILYWVIVYYQIKFFWVYTKRLIMTGFLLVIAPIICVYYGMGQKKIYKRWLKEIIVNIAIQPLHAILYLVFITSAAEIAQIAPLLAIIFFGVLSRGERIVKNIFGMRRLASINSLGTYKIGGKKGK